MRKFLSFFVVMTLVFASIAQTTTLTFTGRDANNRRVQLDRVVITNLTHSWQETITWPDTTLTMQNGVGIVENGTNGGFSLSQNNPNPFDGTTSTALTTAEAGAVALEITDVNGRLVSAQNFASLQHGTHQFRISVASAGTYVLTVRQNGKVTSVKMVNNGNCAADAIEYQGMANESFQLKNGAKGNTNNPFAFGDQMEYVGYATVNGVEYESARITQQQGASQTFALQFEVDTDDTVLPPEGSLNGLFTINTSGERIRFSKGNLQFNAVEGIHACANGTTQQGTWRFAENQYDHVGAENANISASYNGWIDLFGWGTSGFSGMSPYMTSTTGSDYASGILDIHNTYYDWGKYNAISNGGNVPGLWRTLPSSELNYIVNQRVNAANLHAMAVVNDIHGLIILPDDCVLPASIPFVGGLMEYTESENAYTLSQWNALEALGAVFLPVTGVRNGLQVSQINESGYYWSTDGYADNNVTCCANEMWFGRMYIYYNPGISGAADRAAGYGVRLVCDEVNGR